MQQVRETIVAGLFLTQFLYRLQLQVICAEELTDDETVFDYASSKELTAHDYKRLHQSMALTLDMAYEHFGLLKMTRLTKGLFNPVVLQAIAREVANTSEDYDWSGMSHSLGRLAEQYNLPGLFNPFLNRPGIAFCPETIRDQMMQMADLLESVTGPFYQSTDADYRYAYLWAQQFGDVMSMRVALRDAKVHPRDEEGCTTSVANLMPDDNGLFEAFCILHSLGGEMADAWERSRVIDGYSNYRGAVRLAGRVNTSTQRDVMFAGALTAGYPVHDIEKRADDFDDLIMRIPGYNHYQERGTILNIIRTLAPVLYLDLTMDHIHKDHTWRGIRLSVHHDVVQNELLERSDTTFVPVVRMCSLRYANNDVAKWSDVNQWGEHDKDLMDEADRAREVARRSTTLRPSASRVIWLTEQLCDILNDEFHLQGYFR